MNRRIVFVLLCGAFLCAVLYGVITVVHGVIYLTPSFESAATPEQMFEHIIQAPLPQDVTNLQGVGDTWQGYSIYLRFRASPAFIAKFLASGWQKSEWQRIEPRFRLPSSNYDRFAPPWRPDAITEKECYEGQFTNAWGTGTHYLLLDRASGVLYLYGIAG